MTKEASSSVVLWYVYLVRCADQSLYCGVTNNLPRRLAQHNGDIVGGAKYTKARRPVSYMHTHPCANRSEAMKLEIRIKNQKSPEAKCHFIQSLAE